MTRNLRVVDTSVLPTPKEILEQLPSGERATTTVSSARLQIQDVLAERDPRKLVIVGPCSIHDTVAALEYAERLAALRSKVEDDLLIVMRVYFEKPRTTTGWKGLINDPHLDTSNDIPAGLRLARRLLVELNERGMPAATELLDPIIPQYIADLVSWTAIGARTTESQTHREMASGLSMPVGFKNGTDGSLSVAIQAMLAAAHPHAFLGVDDDGRVGVVRTAGNPYTHLVLRGGSGGPNYGRKAVEAAAAQAKEAGVPQRVMIDCSHGNSSKDYRNQPDVLHAVGQELEAGPNSVLGVMIESHLSEGKQAPANLEHLAYGVSITDACVSFPTTEKMLVSFATAVARSRAHTAR